MERDARVWDGSEEITGRMNHMEPRPSVKGSFVITFSFIALFRTIRTVNYRFYGFVSLSQFMLTFVGLLSTSVNEISNRFNSKLTVP